ncbi:hypothetical protein M9Y10_026117 [Tritrichomonas musculus]|uniref:Uncharacterized protein n=1 Tax=Tritrichomonas musculus TaxID=1915356 RepID=A0ABR2HAV1_9EUKA
MTIDDVKKSFKFVKMSQICLFYFTFKIQDNWREQLSKMVIQRCHDYDPSNSPLLIATQISNDLVKNKILTPFDLELNQECFYILSQIADNYKRNLLVDELGISSYNVFLKYFYNENKKDYLYQLIDNKISKAN